MPGSENRRRVLYHVTVNQHWLLAAEILRRDSGWEPVYWIQIPRRVPALRQAFPDVIVHRLWDAFRAIPPKSLAGCREDPLDAPTLGRFTRFEPTFMKMVDRLGPPSAFTFGERRRLWRRQLAVWRMVVRETGVDTIVLANTPHNTYDFALYAVAREAGLDLVMGTDTPIDYRVMWRREIDEQPPGLAERYKSLRNRKLALPPDVADYISGLRKDYALAEPEYMRALRQHRQDWRPTRWAIKAEYLKLTGERYERTKMSEQQWVEYQQWAFERKVALEEEYESLARPVELDVPFVYMPLHYQPERTTSPEAGLYEDQLLVAALLSASLPDGWHLYVREHPSQFSPALFGEMGRDDHLYQDLADLDRVVLVPMSVPPFSLLDASRAVATGTGTAGWEALVRGRPVLVFGNAWYQSCAGAKRVRSLDDVRDAIAQVGGGTLKPQQTEAFAAAVLECGVRVPETAPAGARLDFPGIASEIARSLADMLDDPGAGHST